MELGVADRLNIKLAAKEDIQHNTTGLAGASINGTLKSRNGTFYSVNGSEHGLFDYGESCESCFVLFVQYLLSIFMFA